MRRLLILRHAKAAPPSRDDDFARQLTERGRADAYKVGQWMVDAGLVPDRAIYSGAARTKATYEIVAAAMPRAVEGVEVNALYDATWPLILGLLRELPTGSRAALVVGHNPGVGDIANALAGEGGEFERLRMAGKFPTGALAILAFDRPEWATLSPRSGRLERFVAPGEL